MKAETPLERALGHVFARRELLQQALTHRSFGSPNNERLEFLGDSILNCVIAYLLFQRFSQLREGELSRLRANLVRQDTLFEIAKGVGLGEHLRLGEGELKSGGFGRASILADALEALFGAVYVDAGFAAARAGIEKLYREYLAVIDPLDAGKDAKTALQEYLQARRLALPQYSLIATRGEAHAQIFEVDCFIAELNLRSRGCGGSRRAAEQEAARAALSEVEGT
jgi:ribonuclease-3